ncbi:ankyrin repeat domain-containing protein [Gordonia sp. DT101]|uniref:ankyrin repeat domain-containing protein n=1 Tax=Gordonia sp. DT101 TaxID=3416545 RepID=UPI003CF593FA
MQYLLHEAVKLRDADALRGLLTSESVDVNQRAPDGFTALHWATQEGYAESVEVLLQAQANPNARGPNGMTPLFSALVAPTDRQAGLVMMLIQNGANVRTELENGITFVQIATEIAGEELKVELRAIGLLTA